MNTISLQLKANKGTYTVDAGFMQLSIVPAEINRHMHFIATFVEIIAKNIRDLVDFNASPDKAVMDRIIKHGTALLSTIGPKDDFTIDFSLDDNGKLTCSFSGILSMNLFKIASVVNAMVKEDDDDKPWHERPAGLPLV